MLLSRSRDSRKIKEEIMRTSTVKVFLFVLLCLGVIVAGHAELRAEDCAALRKDIEARIAAAAYCQKDADCEAVSFSCPFGCESLLNRKKIEEVTKKVEGYQQLCEVCANTCGNPIGELRCLEHKCARQ